MPKCVPYRKLPFFCRSFHYNEAVNGGLCLLSADTLEAVEAAEDEREEGQAQGDGLVASKALSFHQEICLQHGLSILLYLVQVERGCLFYCRK